MIEITSLEDECRSIEISLKYCSYNYMSINDVNGHNSIDIERTDGF